ncbi:annexin A13 [Folsomia candida]|uniref:annexin A13 n=1 Tax=Folsomia candida TaxID=158441 RepID=UPI000B8EFCBA|nr:annexin A13 [Folsomia candida]
MSFYSTGSRGSVTGPTDFDCEAACKKLYDGMKGLGTEENVIVEVIGSHTNEQRQEIKDKYKTMYGKDLCEDLESELGGSFSKIVSALMKPPEEYIIECVKSSIAGLGTDEHSLIGLLCVRTNEELEALKVAYKEKYGKEMEEDVAEDLSGNIRALMVGLINGGRDESDDVDDEKVQEDAKTLLEASQGAGTSEEAYQCVFNTRSYPHMRSVFDAYKEISEGKEIEETIESEFSGSMRDAYLALVKIFRSVAGFHAERVHTALKGAGTDDETLIQLIVTRSEVDLLDILVCYQEKYATSLVDDIAEDTSGDYGLILQRILKGTEEENAAEEVVVVETAENVENGDDE